jgi:hypothetical protein
MQTAANEFMKQTKPILSNMVYGHAVATQQQPVAIGTELSNVINNNQPFEGFFNLAPTVRSANPAGSARGRSREPAAPATESRQDNVATMAEVVRLAEQEGITVEEAISGLESDGFTIGD